MIVVSTVFSFVFKQDIENFPIYLLTGQIMFQFFSESTNMAMGAILQNASLMKKVYIPKYIFPISKVMSCSVSFVFSLAALFIVMLFTGTPVSWSILLLPFPIICVFLFSVGIGLILSVYAVYFRDLLHLYGVFTTMFMYLTPIFYPVSALPDWVKTLISFNPLYHFITSMRTIVLERAVPTGENIVLCIFFALASVALGAAIFHKKQAQFVLYI
jgi:ABC-2 type transport system permease protein